MSRAYCERGGHYPGELVATTPVILEYSGGLGVLLDNEGHATRRWEDGVAGVSDEMEDEALSDDDPCCAEHRCPVVWERRT